MEPLNRCYPCSTSNERKFWQLLRYFALDLTASDVAQLSGLASKSVITIFFRIRERIAEACERASPFPAYEDEGADRPAKTCNGIESFWSLAKRRLRKFNGLPPARTFNLSLKECEERFNHRDKNLSHEFSSYLKTTRSRLSLATQEP